MITASMSSASSDTRHFIYIFFCFQSHFLIGWNVNKMRFLLGNMHPAAIRSRRIQWILFSYNFVCENCWPMALVAFLFSIEWSLSEVDTCVLLARSGALHAAHQLAHRFNQSDGVSYFTRHSRTVERCCEILISSLTEYSGGYIFQFLISYRSASACRYSFETNESAAYTTFYPASRYDGWQAWNLPIRCNELNPFSTDGTCFLRWTEQDLRNRSIKTFAIGQSVPKIHFAIVKFSTL